MGMSVSDTSVCKGALTCGRIGESGADIETREVVPDGGRVLKENNPGVEGRPIRSIVCLGVCSCCQRLTNNCFRILVAMLTATNLLLLLNDDDFSPCVLELDRSVDPGTATSNHNKIDIQDNL